MATSGDVFAVLLPLLVGSALVALAILVLRKGGSHLHTRLFGVLFLLSGLKSVGDGLTTDFERADGTFSFVANDLHASSPLFPDAFAWLRVTQLCALAMLPLLFLFCTTFPHPTRWMQHRPQIGALAFVPSALVAVLLFTSPDQHLLANVVLAFNVLATGLTLAAILLLLRTRTRSADHIERQQATYVAMGFLPSFMATWTITGVMIGGKIALIDGDAALRTLDYVLRFGSPIFEILAAGLIAFAILKYNILGVNPKFRIGVKSVLVGTLFAVVFLTTQFIENVILQGKLFAFAGDYGSFLLSGVAGLALFKPIEAVSNRVSNRLLPTEGKPESGVMSRAGEVYQAQCSYVLRDAQVSEREMAFLRNLRAQLGLSESEARAIEEKVERLLKVDAPETGASSTTQPHHISTAHADVAASDFQVNRATPAPESPAPTAEPGPGPQT